MKFQKQVSQEVRTLLTEQLKEYEKHTSMRKEERRELHEWVSRGRSPYDNGDYLCDSDGYPLDFISALRMNQELQEWFNGLSEEEQEAERNGGCYMYSPATDDIYFDVTCLTLPTSDDEDLPFQ